MLRVGAVEEIQAIDHCPWVYKVRVNLKLRMNNEQIKQNGCREGGTEHITMFSVQKSWEEVRSGKRV